MVILDGTQAMYQSLLAHFFNLAIATPARHPLQPAHGNDSSAVLGGLLRHRQVVPRQQVLINQLPEVPAFKISDHHRGFKDLNQVASMCRPRR